MTGAAPVPSGSGCLVEASAGTGKTRRLVDEIVAAIAGGVAVDRITAVTFTHAAAGSMKIRIRRELERRKLTAADPGEYERLKLALQTLDRAFIGTIHSFCAQLLRQRPVEACVDPNFQELSQPEARSVFAQVFRSWIGRRLTAPSPELKRAFARLSWQEDRSAGGPLESLEKAAWDLAEWRDYDAPWQRCEFDRESAISELVAKASAMAELWKCCVNPRDALYLCLRPVPDMLDRIGNAALAGVANVDDVETELLGLKHRVRFLNKGYGRYGKQVAREAVLAAWTGLCESIEEFRLAADADLASPLRDELWQVVEAYQRTKQRAGQLDFADLLIYTRDLLRNDHARRDLQTRYHRIFIDEFQDTDPLQAEILLLLSAADPAQANWMEANPADGKLFVVGDPKQSIYRFRRADARQYNVIREHLLSAGLPRDTLQTSHRSADAIQHFVNAAFQQQLPHYLPLEGGVPAPHSQPSVMVLPVPRVYGSRNISGKVVREWSPPTTAAFIEWLVNKSNWTVRDPSTGERVKIAEDHICVLFRKFVSWGDDLTQEYVRCLEARGIRHVLVGSKSFHQREEVGTVRTALRAIEWPDDELSVFAVLRGSLFFIPDTSLLKFREQYRWFSPMLDLRGDLDPEFDRIADALALLKDLHRRRNHRSPAETIRHLLEHTRAHAGFAFHHGGERRLANLYRLADLARGFELRGASSFRAFVEYLEHEYDSGEQSEAPLLEQQSGGVQLMTVHKAKGLEFPVVILADLTTRMTRQDGSERFVDPGRRLCAQRLCGWAPQDLVDHRPEEDEEDRAEAVRLAYVAATRARDLLVVSAVGEKEWDESWLSPLHDALYPPKDQWRFPSQNPAYPVSGGVTVFERPPEMHDETSIRPGVHRPRCGQHDVFWFDPQLLDLRDRETHGLDHDELLKGTPEQLAEGLRHYAEWKSERSAVIEAGSEARFRVLRASESRQLPDIASVPLEIIHSKKPRASGRTFGKLVHAILQTGSASTIDHVAALHGRRWGASEAEIAAAAESARAAFAHPALAIVNAVELHRELPVSLTLESGEIAEGVIDLAWSDGHCWTVVDYKTGKTEKRHETQVKLYALAMQRATGLPAKVVLLQIG